MSAGILSSFLHNPWMLAGLAALAIPPLIHLLNRRRYDVVDWGAMQFLRTSEVKRRRLFLEDLLLMAVRMALIGVLVVALAGPFFTSRSVGGLSPRPNRDLVLVFDGSNSMGSLDENGLTPDAAARAWALDLLRELAPGDAVAVLRAGQVAAPIVGELSHDLDRVAQEVRRLPPPGGGVDWRRAVKAAHAILASSQQDQRDIVLLSDGQRHGWADPESLFRWELLASELGLRNSQPAVTVAAPRLWVVNVAPDRKPDVPNWALAPLQTSRPVASVGREVIFRSFLDARHQPGGYTPPHRVRLEVDGRHVRNLPPPPGAGFRNSGGRVPFSFGHRFADPGCHLVSVIVDADPPAGQRPPGYQLRDRLPADNRQDTVVEVVPTLPVLLVDGDASASPRQRSTDFLRDALAPAGDTSPAVQVRVIGTNELETALVGEAGNDSQPAARPRPRVVILVDVPRLTDTQQEALSHFLANGGGIFVTLGGRADADAYNAMPVRGAKGWLPARLEATLGTEARPDEAARPVPGAIDHPALQLFLEAANGEGGTPRFPQLGGARFCRWWKLRAGSGAVSGVTVAQLRSPAGEYPFLVEGADPTRAGRVLVAAIPFDGSWGTNLPQLPVFVPLVHEVAYHLAGVRSGAYNLEPGQPLRYRLRGGDSPEGFTLQSPSGEPRRLTPDAVGPEGLFVRVDRGPERAVLRCDGLRETGVYRLRTPDGEVIPYVVRSHQVDESDLTPATEEDRRRVAKLLPGLRYSNDRAQLLAAGSGEGHRQELWWCLLLGVAALLCAEVWMTQRIVRRL
jgi:hypothetical protein